MRIKLHLLLLGFLIFCAEHMMQAQAQAETKRMAVFKIDLSEWSSDRSLFNEVVLKDLESLRQNSLTSLPEHLIRAYSDMEGFTMIDRINYQLVTEERERQKSEDFIDGYTVAQGKSEGIDYMLTSKYLSIDNTIDVRVLEVSTGILVCNSIVHVARGRTGDKATSYYVAQILDELNLCFDISYPVVRMLTSKKEKAKTILVAAGSKHQMKRGRIVELFVDTEIEVDGKLMERQEVVGNGVVIEVDGMNFSIVEIEEGREKLYTLIGQEAKLFCRTANW